MTETLPTWDTTFLPKWITLCKGAHTRWPKGQLLQAQQYMKQQADDDMVYLRLQPYTQKSLAGNINEMFSLRYYGPFEVLIQSGFTQSFIFHNSKKPLGIALICPTSLLNRVKEEPKQNNSWKCSSSRNGSLYLNPLWKTSLPSIKGFHPSTLMTRWLLGATYWRESTYCPTQPILVTYRRRKRGPRGINPTKEKGGHVWARWRSAPHMTN